MSKSKISIVKLSRMLREGKSVKQCAKFFKVTPSAISQAKKELNINVVKNVALENAHRVVDKNLNAVDQLQKINENANEILDLLMRWQRGDDEALQILESQKKVRIGKEKEVVTEYKLKDPRELALKAMAEIRGQLKLQLEIFQTFFKPAESVSLSHFPIVSAFSSIRFDIRLLLKSMASERLGKRYSAPLKSM
jgi:hypothetical protein